MRDYKFRGRVNNPKGLHLMSDDTWVYGENYKRVKNLFGEGYLVFINDYEVDPETVGQYTGLKDKNGVEIYEGDIFVDNSYGEDVGQLIDSVVWNNETGAWVWGKDEVALVAESVDTIMVIGNIFSNPELLGEVKGNG